jgi:hypothetical protein
MNTIKILLAATALVALASPSGAEEKRPHAKAGSVWSYAVTDEIKATKSIVESTLTEAKGGERVLRYNTRGNSNYAIYVFDQNWNMVESPGLKYAPHLGTGVPDPLEVGSQSRTDISSSRQQQGGEWSDPAPVTGEAKIVAVETIATKAGKFEAFRIETVTKYSLPAAPLTEVETKETFWFVPRIDHWVKLQFERRSGGRLVLKSSEELIEYKIK